MAIKTNKNIINMDKVKEYIIENKQKIAIGVLSLAAAGGLIYFLTRSPPPTPQPPVNPLSQSKVSATSTAPQQDQPQPQQDPHQQQLDKVITKVRTLILKNPSQLTPQLITTIIQGQYQLSNQQIKHAIKKSRTERRKKIDDHLEYAKIVTQHQLELETIQEKYLSTILARFNIDKVSWKEANAEWQQATREGEQGISDLIHNEEQKQLLSLRNPSTAPKNIQQISKILSQKISILQSLNPEELGFSLAIDQAALYEMIQTYIEDLIFNEFKIEPEDLEYSIEMLGKKEKEIVIGFEDQIGQLMATLTEVQEEEEAAETQELH